MSQTVKKVEHAFVTAQHERVRESLNTEALSLRAMATNTIERF